MMSVLLLTIGPFPAEILACNDNLCSDFGIGYLHEEAIHGL